VKLLFDENVSPKLAQLVAREYPGSLHVSHAGLRGGADAAIWEYARRHDFLIVSKDTDFRQRSLAEGFPPKIVWLDVGNAATALIVELLRAARPRIESFGSEGAASFLIVSLAEQSA